jgi:hypothetical protein
MNRGYLVLGAAIVLAAVVGLYVLLPGDDTSANREPGVAKYAEPAEAVIRRRPTPTVAPSMPRDPPGATAEGPGTTREQTFGNVVVRDHRTGAHDTIDVPPVIHAAQSRKIASQLSYDISQPVRAAVIECAAGVPREARGPKPRFEGQITIAIKNHQATITDATLKLRDVTGVALDSLKQCVEEKSVGASVPAGDEAELEGYAITMSLRLP